MSAGRVPVQGVNGTFWRKVGFPYVFLNPCLFNAKGFFTSVITGGFNARGLSYAEVGEHQGTVPVLPSK